MNNNFNMMDGLGGMMSWSMGLIGLLAIVVLILSAAALIKYLFRGNK
jgi:4-amino-4-deoxy-L-arabinose transferase-like glycosyltransferase